MKYDTIEQRNSIESKIKDVEQLLLIYEKFEKDIRTNAYRYEVEYLLDNIEQKNTFYNPITARDFAVFKIEKQFTISIIKEQKLVKKEFFDINKYGYNFSDSLKCLDNSVSYFLSIASNVKD